jgi:hypothetical protein
MTFLFLNVDIENIYIQKRKGTGCIMRQTTRRKIGRLEDWKIGRLEDWKIGRLEDFALRVVCLMEDCAQTSGSFPQSSEVQENKNDAAQPAPFISPASSRKPLRNLMMQESLSLRRVKKNKKIKK